MMMKKVMKATVMKKNLVSLFIYYNKKISVVFSKNIDEEELSEGEVSADPVEGRDKPFILTYSHTEFFS